MVFWILYLIPAVAILISKDIGIGYWTTPVLVFIGLPLLDLLLGDSDQNFETLPKPKLKTGDLALILYCPVSLGLILFQAHRFSQINVSVFDKIGIVASTAICTGGLGITIAHELIHRANKFENWTGRLLLAWVSYGHFAIEHVYGHHKNVGTPQDPVTARKGENVFGFYFRAVIKSFQSAWGIEANRLAQSKSSVFSLSNKIIQMGIITFLLGAGIMFLFGIQGLLFFILQAWGAFTLLEIINYVEHYGLSRRDLGGGKFEPVGPQHSWDSYKKLSNWFLINLQRHSDHHKYANRHFMVLRRNSEASQLPYGYPTMVLIALVPPLWFLTMNPRLKPKF